MLIRKGGFQVLRPVYYWYGDSEARGIFGIFEARLLSGNTAVVEITIGGWANVIIRGYFFLHILAWGDL